MKKRAICLLLTALVLCAVSCRPAENAPAASQGTPAPPTPSPEAENVSFVTPEPTASFTLEPIPTPTPTPEVTPTPAPTDTPEPTDTPVPDRIGILRYDLIDKFSDRVIDTNDRYVDGTICITVTRTETKERTGNTLVYFVADIYVQNVESIRRGIGGSSYRDMHARSIKKFSKECSAIVAMSGDYCTTDDPAFVVVNGFIVHQTKELNRDLCVLFRDGEMKTYSPGDIDTEALKERGVWQTWNFGPMLLDENGEPLKEFNSPDRVFGRNPRAVLGYFEPGHYCFVVVDGRQNGYSMGLTLEELAALMKDLGCKAAYNLDGGISAQIAWHAKRLNHPGKDRSLIDIVYVPYPEAAEDTP